MLVESGHEAVGVDPDAPEGDCYLRVGFEEADLPRPFDAVVACTSLHHVSDTGEVVAAIRTALRPGGKLVIVQWDWDSLAEPTASWAFERLGDEQDRPETGATIAEWDARSRASKHPSSPGRALVSSSARRRRSASASCS